MSDSLKWIRVWPPGTAGCILGFQNGILCEIRDADAATPNEITDPADPETLRQPHTLIAIREMTTYLLRAFGAASPLLRSPSAIRQEAARILAPYIHNKHLLDVGCGHPNQLLDWDALCPAQVNGLDIVKWSDEETNSSYRIIADDGTWPFPDNHFDQICGIFVLEHVPNLYEIFKEAARVMKPGARALWITTHMPIVSNIHEVQSPVLSIGHLREFSSVKIPNSAWIVSFTDLYHIVEEFGCKLTEIWGTAFSQQLQSIQRIELRSGEGSSAQQLWFVTQKATKNGNSQLLE